MDYRTERYDWQEIFTADLGFLHFPTTLQFIGSANSIQAPFGKQLYTFRKKRPLQLQAFCGGCWEMWNYYSLARWEYSISFVHKFQIFEMPLLGYAGYLPFGLECTVIGDLMERWMKFCNTIY